jgi:hypothetical protein
MDLKKLNSMHYKLLRIAIRDWKNRIPRDELDHLGRARPYLWGKYANAYLAIKVLRDQVPRRLECHINKTRYTERRSGLKKFYDASRKKIGTQAISNCLCEVLEEVKEPITFLKSNDRIRRLLKTYLGFIKPA